jgi:hypothetical protein
MPERKNKRLAVANKLERGASPVDTNPSIDRPDPRKNDPAQNGIEKRLKV